VTKRAKKLADVGITAFYAEDRSTIEEDFITSIAAMLDEATKKSSAKKKQPALPFPPQDVFEGLKEVAPTMLEYEYTKTTFGRLGTVLRQIPNLKKTDLERMLDWVRAGGLDWWTRRISFDKAVPHVKEWILNARAWEKRGRQNLGSRVDELAEEFEGKAR